MKIKFNKWNNKKFVKKENEIKESGDPPRWPRDTPLSTKVDTKFRRQVAVAQLV
jgi:hypothetical protein